MGWSFEIDSVVERLTWYSRALLGNISPISQCGTPIYYGLCALPAPHGVRQIFWLLQEGRVAAEYGFALLLKLRQEKTGDLKERKIGRGWYKHLQEETRNWDDSPVQFSLTHTSVILTTDWVRR
jgi:hypothetical protein